MSEQNVMMGKQRDVDLDELRADAAIAPEEGLAIERDVEAPSSETDREGTTESGPQRRPRTRPKSTETVRRASDFDPTSRGDERGEVM